MNQTDFEIVFNQTIKEIKKLLVVKGGEYAGDTDCLSNFKRGAELAGLTPLQCLFVYMSKHYDAVATYVRDDAKGVGRTRSEPIAGRLDDLINYCILAKAIIREKEKANAVACVVGSGDSVKYGIRIPGSTDDAATSFPGFRTSDQLSG